MRIIAGTANGRKLKTLPGIKTRPTADKVKGAIFSVLADKVPGAKVLDLFAGSGALGLEALSRGAGHALMVDKNASACKIISENSTATGLVAKTQIVSRDAIATLKDLKENFDLIFLDPPYKQGLSLASLQVLGQGNYLTPNGVIIVETSREEEIPVEVGNLGMRKESRYGDTVIRYYQPTETGGN